MNEGSLVFMPRLAFPRLLCVSYVSYYLPRLLTHPYYLLRLLTHPVDIPGADIGDFKHVLPVLFLHFPPRFA